MKRLAVLLAVALVSSAPALARKRVDPYADTPAEIQSAKALKLLMGAKLGTAYMDLRREAVDAGFQPVAAGNGVDNSRCRGGFTKVCATFPETLHCGTADDGADCRFLLQYDESWFVIGTRVDGETQRLTNVNWLDLAEKNKLRDQLWSLNGR